jgi:hypothetical protein
MKRRLTRLAAASLVAVVCAGTVAIAAALAVVPPAGTPDLPSMVIQPSDLAPGAPSASGGYVKPGKGLLAAYNSSFRDVTTTAGVRLAGVETSVALASSSANAHAYFKDLRAVYGSKKGRLLIAAEIAKGAGAGAGLKRSDFSFARVRAVGVGDQSALEPFTMHIKGVKLAADLLVLRAGDVLANLTVVGLGGQLTPRVATALGATVAAHIAAVLAGSTGASGATGATGATG